MPAAMPTCRAMSRRDRESCWPAPNAVGAEVACAPSLPDPCFSHADRSCPTASAQDRSEFVSDGHILAAPSDERLAPTKRAARRPPIAWQSRIRSGLRLRLEPGIRPFGRGPARRRHGRGTRGAACSSPRSRDRRLAGEQVLDLVAGQRLVFEQRLGQRFRAVAMLLGEDAARVSRPIVDQAPDLGVDLLRRRPPRRSACATTECRGTPLPGSRHRRPCRVPWRSPSA